MANYTQEQNTSKIVEELLRVYDKVMVLKIYINSDDIKLRETYLDAVNSHNKKLIENIHHIDAGFDLFSPGNEMGSKEECMYGEMVRFYGDVGKPNKVNFNVCCSARMYLDTLKNYNTGYYMYPRSSLSKTKLRLANSVGIIDAGYRGNLIGMFDLINTESPKEDEKSVCDYFGKKFDRYLQICAPDLAPIVVEIVDSNEELGDTARGANGFGSSGR